MWSNHDLLRFDILTVSIQHSVIEDLWASYVLPWNTEENEHPHCFSDLEIFERHSKFVSILTDWHRVCLCHQLLGQMLKYDIHHAWEACVTRTKIKTPPTLCKWLQGYEIFIKVCNCPMWIAPFLRTLLPIPVWIDRKSQYYPPFPSGKSAPSVLPPPLRQGAMFKWRLPWEGE